MNTRGACPGQPTRPIRPPTHLTPQGEAVLSPITSPLAVVPKDWACASSSARSCLGVHGASHARMDVNTVEADMTPEGKRGIINPERLVSICELQPISQSGHLCGYHSTPQLPNRVGVGIGARQSPQMLLLSWIRAGTIIFSAEHPHAAMAECSAALQERNRGGRGVSTHPLTRLPTPSST